MDSMVVFAIGFAALIVFIASLWYLFQTLRVIWSYSSLLAIAAVFFSPLVHIVFYFFPKDGFDRYEKLLFKRYFLSLAAIAVLGIFAAIAIPAVEQRQNDNMVSDLDASQPWEWDIRAEDPKEVLAASVAATDSDTEKAAELHFEAIYQAHPDADKVMESSDFKTWLQEKTVEDQNNVSRILKEGTAAEVIYVFSIFKKDLENNKAYEYQARRDNAQALAQTQYQEKKNRNMEAVKAHNQRSQQAQYQQLSTGSATPNQEVTTERQLSYDEKLERERIKALISQPVNGSKGLTASQREQLLALEQAPAPTVKRGYSERLEYEREKARIREPIKGTNGELTRGQRDALVALETGQPMPSRQ